MKDPGLPDASGKHPAASALISTDLISAVTVDAAYYRAGTEVPESVLTLPEIGSSNNLDEAGA